MAFLSDQVNQNGILLILVSISDKNYAAILIYRKNTGIYYENIGMPIYTDVRCALAHVHQVILSHCVLLQQLWEYYESETFPLF